MTETILDYPYRSPLKVAEVLKELIKDKVVCDVGCACGDLMIEFSKYAKRVIGIEERKEEREITIKRGLEVVDNLPDADVYYVWVGIDDLSFLEMFKDKKGKLVLVEEDRIKELGGYEISMPIEEVSTISNYIGNDRTIWHLQIVEL